RRAIAPSDAQSLGLHLRFYSLAIQCNPFDLTWLAPASVLPPGETPPSIVCKSIGDKVIGVLYSDGYAFMFGNGEPIDERESNYDKRRCTAVGHIARHNPQLSESVP